MTQQQERELSAAADQLLHALFQFRNVFRPDNFPHPGSPPGFEGLRHSEVGLLFMLEKAGRASSESITVSDLSRMMNVKPPSITPNLTRLEQRGLIERTMDPNDRRIVRVSLKETGREIIRDHRRKLLEWMEGLVHHLGVEQSLEMARLIDATYQYAREHAPAGGPCCKRERRGED